MNPVGLHSHEDKLLDFAYGELPDGEARAMEAHVKGCHRCTGALENLRGVRATMAKLTPEPAPDAGLESLLAYAQQAARRTQEAPEKKKSPAWHRWLMPVTAVAAFSLAGVVAVQSLRAAKAPEAPAQLAMADRSSAGTRSKAEAPSATPEAKLAEKATTGQLVRPKSEAGGALAVDVESPRRESAKAKSKGARADGYGYGAKGGRVAYDEAPASADVAASSGAPADEERQAFAESASKVRHLSESQVASGPPAAPTPAPAANAAPTAMPMQVAQAPSRAERGSGLSMRGTAKKSSARMMDEPAPAEAALPPLAKELEADKADDLGQGADPVAEARRLRQAVASNPPRAELAKLLTRLCDVEVENGLETTGCERLMREFPNTQAAQVAQRRLLAAPGASSSKAAAPAAAKPAAPARRDDGASQQKAAQPAL